MTKGTKLYSIIFSKCPKCQESDMFENNNPYVLSKLTKMHKSCETCGLNYSPEPGFYFGAAYVSYAFNIALLITFFVFFQVVGVSSDLEMILYPVIGMLLLVPVMYRFSRIVWINMFVKYDKNAISNYIK